VKLRTYTFKALGGPCELRLYGRSAPELKRVADLAQAEVRRIECKYSRYRDDSVTAEINRSAGDKKGVSVDAETAQLLNYAEICFQQSGGLFDITSGVLRAVWDFKSGCLPRPEAVREVLERVGWRKIEWNSPRLVLPVAGMELDFGGYGKEYAVDQVADLCRRHKIKHGLVDLGGDLAVIGPHPDGSPWNVGIRDPRAPDKALASIPLRAGGIASSGDYERFMIVDGKRYGHILDPRTGWPIDGLASVSVIAPRCLVAGTATTVAMLKGERDGARWLDELGLPNMRVTQDGELGGSIRVIRPSA